MNMLTDANALRIRVADLGYWGPLAIIGLMTFAVVLSPIPSAPIAVASGAVYGHFWGTGYVLIGAEIGALIAFTISRVLGQDIVYRWFGERVRIRLLGSQRALMGIVFVSRLMPFISFDLVSYAAGFTSLSAWRFAIATLAGIVPASFFLAHLGGEIVEGKPDRALAAVLLLGALILVPLAIRFFRRHRG